MKNLKYIFSTLLLVLFVVTNGQIKEKGRTGKFALTNARIETVTNGVIENGSVIIENGKILDVGAGINIPSDAETINCSGLTIYPGLINCGGNLGLQEISAVDRTVDHAEIGEVIPHMQALTAVNPNSAVIPVTRVNGITTNLSFPSSGLFPGTAALINLFGYNPDQMFAGFKGVVMNFPTSGKRGRWDRRSDEEVEKAYKSALEKLDDVYQKAIQYHKIDSATNGKPQDYYPEMEALLPVVRGEMKLLVNVEAAKDINKLLEWVKGKNLDVVICGAAEGWRVADKIAEAGIPVITGPVLSTPTRAYDRYDRPYSNPALMKEAGVKVAVRSDGNQGNFRNLPYEAGFAAAYGLGKDDALKAITIVPAEILGMNETMGSIEKGKVANVFVSDGDIFETKTQVKHLFIAGWKVPLESRHTQLYEEFLERSPGVDD